MSLAPRYSTLLRLFILLFIVLAGATQLWRNANPQGPGPADESQPSILWDPPAGHMTPTSATDLHEHCHFHAGIEHCTGGSHGTAPPTSHCEKVDRNYNVTIRLCAAVVVLLGSAAGVFAPILLSSSRTSTQPPNRLTIALKQCGTGVIISTAFVHLFTHASMMFNNECLADYNLFEGITATIFMVGMVLSFLVDFVAYQQGQNHGLSSVTPTTAALSKKERRGNIIILEAGIIFHSILIGMTLVVAADGYFVPLTAVITLHQMFEGLALGTRLAALENGSWAAAQVDEDGTVEPLLPRASKSTPAASSPTSNFHGEPSSLHRVLTFLLQRKNILATCFTLVTPLGMVLGIMLLDIFNGNNPNTIIAIGTLDALSAGILAWFGVVEMWAHDWLVDGAEMASHWKGDVVLGLGSLVAGMAMMTVLGKWA